MDESTTSATTTDHREQFCDIIMKGGITSGVVYPSAVCELAGTYRFKSIGGTSAGAIAAALTAAAEHARAHGSDAGFVIEVDGRMIGHIGLFGFDPLARSAEVGLALAADSRGRGYGTDAMRVIVGFGFERRHLHRIHLTVLASNAIAIASYRKVGFVEEGRLRESAWLRGHYEDELRMGLLRSEWGS